MDSIISQLISDEAIRQASSIELIASENYQSPQVLAAQSSVFANKYAEWYPGKRYYGWQNYTDQLEQLAIDRAKALFHADHANVQALSGAAANIAIYFGLLDPGDTILGMDLSHGGHLTHGSPVTFMSKIFNFIGYKTLPDGSIDYDELRHLALTHRPKMLLAGFSSYTRQLDYPRFVQIADEIGAIAFADMSHIGWLIAGWVVPNPLDAGFHVMMTTTHKSLRWPRWALILSKGLVSNPLKSVPKIKEHIPTLIDRAVFPGIQWGPHMNTIAAIAVALDEATTPAFQEYAGNVLSNAQAFSQAFIDLWYDLITGGTENHMIVIDLRKQWIDGDQAQKILDAVHISTSKSPIPNDPNPPFRPSGLRLGVQAMTTRWATPDDMHTIAHLIDITLQWSQSPESIKQQVVTLAQSLKMYG